MMEMTLRFEIFPSDLDEVVDFYTRVLRFGVTKDQRHEPSEYVSMRRGAVQVGVLRTSVPDARATRLPPAGVELVLEVDDVAPNAIGSWRPVGRWNRISRIARGG